MTVYRFLMFILLLPGVALPQITNYGRLVGRVTDPTGAVIPGADVSVTNIATGAVATTVANDRGNYEFPNLLPGNYTLKIESSGFKRYERGPIELRVGDFREVNVQLEVGTITQSVVVNADASQLEATTSSLGQATEHRRIVDLPLAGGSPFYMVQMTAAITQTTSPGHGWLPQAIGPVSNAVVAGTPNGSSEFTLDGIPNMSGASGGSIAFSPPPEMVQEMRVETAPFDAGAGHFTGGQINMVLAGGTNDFHGNLFFSQCSRPFMTVPFFVNRSIYDPTGGPPTEEKRNSLWPYVRTSRYRATASGPVFIPKLYDGRKKTFWTFGFDWLERMRPQTVFQTVPTAKERQGDFSDLLALGNKYQIYDPGTIAPAPNNRFSRKPLAGNIIPPSRLDPMALKLINYFPLPNVQGTADGIQNYTDPAVLNVDYKSEIVRIDHNFSDKHRFAASLSLYTDYEVWNDYFHNAASGQNYPRRHRGFSLDDVLILRPNMILNLRYGFTRLTVTNSPTNSFPFDLASLGFPASLTSQLDPKYTKFPNITFGTFTSLGAVNWSQTNNFNEIFSGSLSYLRGSHSLRAGTEFRVSFTNPYSPGNISPSIAFSTNWTRGPFDNSAAAPIGQDLASFLLGYPTGGFIDRNDSLASMSKYTAFFLQDD